MDLEYFRHRQQVSLLMSENAACSCSRIVHRKMAEGYVAIIDKALHSDASNSPAAANWSVN